VTEWLGGNATQPKPPKSRQAGRNGEWVHANMEDVVSMPDKWKFPWFAAWDWSRSSGHARLPRSGDAKYQLILLCQSWYMHPNGPLPAYQWNFSDLNLPVHAWVALRLYDVGRRRKGKGDRKFLETVFTKLLLNFIWWVNRKDPRGRKAFEGGFLGLDNIGVFDRSAPLPVNGTLVRFDGASCMAMYCLNMLRMAIELAQEEESYQDIATKLFEHFLMIGGAMTSLGGKGVGLWDDRGDNFFYDWPITSNGEAKPLRLRSLVSLAPMFAVGRRRSAAGKDAVVLTTAELVSALSAEACGPGVSLGQAGCRRHPPARHNPRFPFLQAVEARSRQGRVSVRVRSTGAVAISPRPSVRLCA
jgi:hypothetical protein